MQTRKKKSEWNQLWIELIEFFKLFRLFPSNYLRLVIFVIAIMLEMIKKCLQIILTLFLMLIELFSKLIPSKDKDPLKRSFSNQNYNKLRQYSNRLIDFRGNNSQYTLVLELDEIFVKVSKDKKGNFTFEKKNDAQEFIKHLLEFYNVIIYTRLNQKLADQIIDHFEIGCYLSQRFYDSSCHKHPVEGNIKDLAFIPQLDLNKTLLLDNIKLTQLNKNNTLRYTDQEDLKEYIEYLQELVLDEVNDVREEIENLYAQYENE